MCSTIDGTVGSRYSDIISGSFGFSSAMGCLNVPGGLSWIHRMARLKSHTLILYSSAKSRQALWPSKWKHSNSIIKSYFKIWNI